MAREELPYQIGEVLVTYERRRKVLLRKWKSDAGSLVAVAGNLLGDLQKTDSGWPQKLRQRPGALRAGPALAHPQFLAAGTVNVRLLLLASKGRWPLEEGQCTWRVAGAKGNDEALTVVELPANRLPIHDATQAKRQDEVSVPAD